MAIAKVKPTTDFAPVQTTPQFYADNYHGLVYDDKQTPLSSLIAFMEGSAWTLKHYFKQNTAQHNDLKMVDVGLDAQFQGYDRIDGLEIMVDNDLSNAANTVQQTMKVSGSAHVAPFFVPNVGDYFIVDAGFDAPALFILNEVERKTFKSASAHYINYQLVDYLDRIPLEVANLFEKTIRTYVFSKQRLMEGLGPILESQQYNNLLELQQEYVKLGDYYLQTFHDRGTKTLILPGQMQHRIYDHFLVDFVMRTYSFDLFPQLFDVKQLNKSGDKYLDQPNFWTAFLDRDMEALKWGNERMQFVMTGQFEANTWIKSLFHARMDMVVYPFEPDMSVNSYEAAEPLATFDGMLVKTTNAKGRTLTVSEKEYVFINKVIESYPMVNFDKYYVLSENFYEGKGDKMSLLELLVRDYMSSSALDEKGLRHMLKLYPRMERMEQFYYGPILMVLVRYFDQRAYTP